MLLELSMSLGAPAWSTYEKHWSLELQPETSSIFRFISVMVSDFNCTSRVMIGGATGLNQEPFDKIQ